MERQTITDVKGRHYEAWIGENGMSITIGPPEGLVDELALPEPFATRLHNILHNRGFLSISDATRRPKELQAALQEALMIDIQATQSAYLKLGG